MSTADFETVRQALEIHAESIEGPTCPGCLEALAALDSIEKELTDFGAVLGANMQVSIEAQGRVAALEAELRLLQVERDALRAAVDAARVVIYEHPFYNGPAITAWESARRRALEGTPKDGVEERMSTAEDFETVRDALKQFQHFLDLDNPYLGEDQRTIGRGMKARTEALAALSQIEARLGELDAESAENYRLYKQDQAWANQQEERAERAEAALRETWQAFTEGRLVDVQGVLLAALATTTEEDG